VDEPSAARITCYQRAWLKLLAEDRAISVRAVHLSGRRMRIVLSESLALSAFSIETAGWLKHSRRSMLLPREYSHYVAELQLNQKLVGLQDISAWRRFWINRMAEPSSFVVRVDQEPPAVNVVTIAASRATIRIASSHAALCVNENYFWMKSKSF
jgi:hypothetical protein